MTLRDGDEVVEVVKGTAAANFRMLRPVNMATTTRPYQVDSLGLSGPSRREA
jgi:hypothetical protein